MALLTIPKKNGKKLNKMLEITNLFTIKKFWGKKFANIIINYILMNYLQYKKLNKYILCALPISDKSIYLFKKFGFIFDGKRGYFIYSK